MGLAGVVALDELLSDEAMLLAGRAAPTWTADRMRSRLPAHPEQDTRPSRPALVPVCSKTDAEGVCTCDVSAGGANLVKKNKRTQEPAPHKEMLSVENKSHAFVQRCYNLQQDTDR